MSFLIVWGFVNIIRYNALKKNTENSRTVFIYNVKLYVNFIGKPKLAQQNRMHILWDIPFTDHAYMISGIKFAVPFMMILLTL